MSGRFPQSFRGSGARHTLIVYAARGFIPFSLRLTPEHAPALSLTSCPLRLLPHNHVLITY